MLSILFLLENSNRYNKHIDVLKKLDLQRENILRANTDGIQLSGETKKEYDALKIRKNAIINKDKDLAKMHQKYLEEYNSILKEKQCLQEEIEKINLKSKTFYNVN